MHTYIIPLAESFQNAANLVRAEQIKRYMKNLFPFFGIETKIRRSLQQAHFKQYGLPEREQLNNIVRELWELPEREFQLTGFDILQKFVKKLLKEDIEFFEELIVAKSWWDTVDMLASWCCGFYFKSFPEQIEPVTSKWMQSGNIWLQRSCLLYQLKYKSETDFNRLKEFILKLKDSKGFFIQKAIGWILREYSKTNPSAVVQFVQSVQLAPLSHREAMKVILKN